MRLGRVAAPLLSLLLVGALTTGSHADDRWAFYTKDKRHYTSPWFNGAHRIMIPFGCTRAPYYSPEPRCASTYSALPAAVSTRTGSKPRPARS